MNKFKIKVWDKIPYDGKDDAGVITQIRGNRYTVNWTKDNIYFEYNEGEIIAFLCGGSYFTDFKEKIEDRLG